MTLNEIEILIANTNLELVDIQASFRDRFEFMQPSEQYALKKADGILIKIIAFEYDKLRSIPNNMNDFMTGRSMRLSSDEPFLSLISLNDEFHEVKNEQLHAQTMSLFHAAGDIELSEHTRDILHYLQTILSLFKANLHLSEYRYFLSLNHSPDNASVKSAYVSDGPLSTSWLDVFKVTIEPRISEIALNKFEKIGYRDCIVTLTTLEQLLRQLRPQLESLKRKQDDNKDKRHSNGKRRISFR